MDPRTSLEMIESKMCFKINKTFSMFYYYSSIFTKNNDLAGFWSFFIPGLSGFLGVFECSSDGKSSTPVGNTASQ